MQTGADADLQLREMTPQDLPGAHALSKEVKWPHRLEDWELMLRVGSGFVVEENGEVVGAILGFPCGETAATLGMVIVTKSCRGRGIARRLMEAMIARLAPRSIQLNATPEGIGLYKSLGFAPVGSIHQHQGAAFKAPLPKLRPNERVRPMSASDADRVAQLDARACGLERPALLAELFQHGQGVVLAREGEAVGFALLRRFGNGHAIGPVVAPDREGARTLITHWLGAHPGAFMRVDVPGDCGLTDWLEAAGLEEVNQVVTMVRGSPAVLDPSVAGFAIVSQALS